MRAFALAALFLVAGCTTYRDDLHRGQRLYMENHYDQALAMWRVLEADMDSLSPAERSQYAYLRGMTDYRLAMRAEARHWLAIAKVNHDANPGGLDASIVSQLDKTLAELNDEAYQTLVGK